MGRVAEVAADVGNAGVEGADRSSVVFRDGLVSDFSGSEGNRAEERIGRGMDSVSCGGPGKFFWRMDFWSADQARMVGRGGAEIDGGVWWIWCDAADTDDFYNEAVADYVVVCDRDVCVRVVFDDCECAADGFVREPCGGDGERNERDSGGDWDDYCVRIDWAIFGCECVGGDARF